MKETKRTVGQSIQHSSRSSVQSSVRGGLLEGYSLRHIDTAAIIRAVVSALITFGLTGAKMLSVLSPFAVAFLASLNKGELLFSFGALVLGYIVRGTFTESIGYVAAAAIIVAIKFYVSLGRMKPASYVWALVSAGASAATSVTTALLSSASGFAAVQGLCEGILAGGFTYFLLVAYRVLGGGVEISLHNETDIAALLAVVTVTLTALANYGIAGLNFGRILAVPVVLAGAYKYRAVGGAISGIMATTAMTLFDTRLAASSAVFTVAGLLAGLFSVFGRTIVMLMMFIISMMGLLITSLSQGLMYFCLDLILGCTLFMFIPDSIFTRFSLPREGAASARSSCVPHDLAGTTDSEGMKNLLQTKLSFAASTMEDIKQSVEEVSKRLAQISGSNLSQVYNKASDEVCAHCGLNIFCWEKAYNLTMNALNDTVPCLKEKGKIEKDDVPQHLRLKCCHSRELIDAINQNYRDYITGERTSRRISEMRWILTEQFDSMAKVLRQLSDDISQVRRIDERSSDTVRSIISDLGIKKSSVSCVIDSYDRMSVEIYFDKQKELNAARFCERVSDVLGREFDLPEATVVDGIKKLTMFEKSSFLIEFDAMQLCYNGNKVCGDSYEFFTDDHGYAYLILSDGMGTGSRAAVDSVMVCSLLLKLIRGGFGIDAAIQIVNSSLSVKSEEETISTVDIVRVDLYTGKAEIFKAGASSTFLRKGGSVSMLDSTSLPIGIVGSVETDHYATRLSSGDLIVMVSDGVVDTDPGWVETEIGLYRDLDCKELAVKIANEAKRRRRQIQDDDITVMVAKLKKGV